MIELRRRQWIIDQTPRILFSGEVHCFRLARRDWRSRLLDLRAAGAQAVATSIPLGRPRLPDGTIDVTGRTADPPRPGASVDLINVAPYPLTLHPPARRRLAARSCSAISVEAASSALHGGSGGLLR